MEIKTFNLQYIMVLLTTLINIMSNDSLHWRKSSDKDSL